MAKGTNKPIEFDLEDICEMIVEGDTFRKISTKYDCSISTLHNYLCKSEHTARTSLALQLSASSYANKGEQVLIDAEPINVEIQRARELAQHYRWMAGKRNPGKYGEKVSLDGAGSIVKQTFIVNGKEIEF